MNNLTVIIEISSTNGYMNIASPKNLLFRSFPPPSKKKGISKGKTIQLVIKSTCAQQIKDARTRAPVKNVGKAHMRPMHDCVCKTTHTHKNNAFMILVSLPPTFGSSSKLI